MAHFEDHLGAIHDYSMATLSEVVECIVTHGADEYAHSWNANTVEDYLHLLATDELLKTKATEMTGDPSMRIVVEDTLRGIVRIMAHVAQNQEVQKVHE